ncbi:XRE family transcriptional regulator [Aneurinibacillus sp. Ricciae_BoGa-3]|uniref:helix-turn-helix domain-containing protein n=1 Tax=Aneurinibacillus sp. Ricciae_BoGa-3 TaxID=3022697 RepID=UPI00234066A2|nr:XRE family transcriptional regulator [Aneurinibacillus sp. Ricciae_BoGa-3]WCK54907.1 XRE family transcriptional regulator [Aneurinibacillus sp. Ricciae_BoGa-3]
MENINFVIAKNLKMMRENKKLSLEKVSEMTGVSKTMLGQIERGESSPTITTVWKIAKGLKISFTSLINNPQPDTVVVSSSDIEPLIEDNGKYRLYPFFPFEEGRRFEVYAVEIDKGGYLSAEAHTEGTEEFITVFGGELTVRVNNEEYTIKEGDSIRFRADREHAYHNSGETLTSISMLIYYPN